MSQPFPWRPAADLLASGDAVAIVANEGGNVEFRVRLPASEAAMTDPAEGFAPDRWFAALRADGPRGREPK